MSRRVAQLSNGLGALVAAAALVSCATLQPATPTRARVVAEPAPRPPQPTTAPEPLSARERGLSARLAPVVRHLAEEIGERNFVRPWELAAAADYLVNHLEERGLAVQRRGFELEGGYVMAQNLAVTLPGADGGREWVVVGAAYDSRVGADGSLGDATAAAALVELAQAFRTSRMQRSLRLVWFGNSTPENGANESLGGAHFARQMAAAEERVVAMLELRSLAVGKAGDLGSWEVLVESDEASSQLGTAVAKELVGHLPAPLGVRRRAADLGQGQAPAAWAFRALGNRAVSVFVAPRSGTVRHLSAVDFDATARIVGAVEDVLRGMLGTGRLPPADAPAPAGSNACCTASTSRSVRLVEG